MTALFVHGSYERWGAAPFLFSYAFGVRSPRGGCALHNAAAEAFNGMLKVEFARR